MNFVIKVIFANFCTIFFNLNPDLYSEYESRGQRIRIGNVFELGITGKSFTVRVS